MVGLEWVVERGEKSEREQEKGKLGMTHLQRGRARRRLRAPC